MSNEENLHQRGGVQLNDLNAEGGLPEGQQMNDLNENNKVTAAGQEKKWLNGDYGYPFPMGPLIPLPDLKHPPLWPGLLKKDLNRPRAAAIVFKNSYLGSCKIDINNVCSDAVNKFAVFWGRQEQATLENGLDYNDKELAVHGLVKGINNKIRGLANGGGRRPFNRGVDTALRNFVKRIYPGQQGDEYKSLVVDILKEWAGMVSDVFDRGHLGVVVDDFNRIYSNAGARDNSFLFSGKYYPDFNGGGDVSESGGSVNNWYERYDQGVKEYVKALLERSGGEWEILALLFNKLMHAHMGWRVPSSKIGKRKEFLYKPLLDCLQRCAKNESHPLARIAAGIWMNMRHIAPLFDSKGKLISEVGVIGEGKAINARDENLPDSLHVDSLMWVDECVGEVVAILGDNFKGVIYNVYFLAQEIASYLTDPFAMVGMGFAKSMPSEAQLISEEVRRRLVNNIQIDESCGVSCVVSARAYLIRGFDAICERYKNDKSGFEDVVSSFNGDEGDNFFVVRRFRQVNERVGLDEREHFLDKIEYHCKRMAQLRNFYVHVREMLLHYGLNEFQGKQP